MLKFKNYTPQTQLLEGTYTIEKCEPESIKTLIQDKLDLLEDETVDLNSKDQCRMDMKMVDWDLKRRIGKRMEKLEDETRKAIERHIKSNKG